MRAVGFDFDHTLGIDRKLERDALLQILEEEDRQENQSRDDLLELINEALECYRSGAEELDSALTDLFARALEPGYDPAELAARFRERAVQMAPEYIQARPHVVDLLTRLRRANIRIAILTNGWAPLQNKKAELVGFDAPVLISDELGFRKPDKRAFAALERTLDVPASEILFVGDSPPIDIQGAINYGMSAAWYDWENHQYPDGVVKPTHVVTDLLQIADIAIGQADRA